MEVLRTQHNERFLRLPNEILQGLGAASGEMVQEMIDKGDDYMKRVWRSYLASRENTMRHLRFNEQAFLNARTLQFRFPTSA
jgi:TRAP-type mannitol/chloroaromatic compound transport system substrate-binding protein